MSGIHPKWLAPTAGCVKINVDTATSKAGDGGAVAAVCRREDGAFLGASALAVQGSSSPATLEALACREALAPTQDLNIRWLCVATDCLEVANNLDR
jgi:ribonuclease HI